MADIFNREIFFFYTGNKLKYFIHRKNYCLFLFGIFIISIHHNILFSAPIDDELHCYVKVENMGVVDIPNHSYLQGSANFGGAQPDYYIDYESPPIKNILQEVKKEIDKNIKSKIPLTQWDKIKIAQHVIHKHAPHWEYAEIENNAHSSCYKNLMTTYREANHHIFQGDELVSVKVSIPLSKYISICKHAVCRGNALITHFVLNGIGISNQHVYAKVTTNIDSSDQLPSNQAEDHAFNLVSDGKGNNIVVDSYEDAFNGFRIDDLTSPKGVPHKNDPNIMRVPISYSDNDQNTDSRGKAHPYKNRSIHLINLSSAF